MKDYKEQKIWFTGDSQKFTIDTRCPEICGTIEHGRVSEIT